MYLRKWFSLGLSFELMHGDVHVADLDIDERSCSECRVTAVRDPSRMPIGSTLDGILDPCGFHDWWTDRPIPDGRDGLRDLLEETCSDDPAELMVGSLALSLTDRYWVRPSGSDLLWDEVNFFRNGFPVGSGGTASMSPDHSTGGLLMKHWETVGGRRVLVKHGVPPLNQEVINEAVASLVADAMDVDHVGYGLIGEGSCMRSVCDCFVADGREFVPAHSVLMSSLPVPGEDVYGRYVRVCAENGLDVVPFLDRMICFDFLIGNCDRHTNNFGIMRDPESLEWVGPAPLFDNGSSLGCGDGGSRPFRETFREQILLVRSFDWFDMGSVEDVLPDVDAMVRMYAGDDMAHDVSVFLDGRIRMLRPVVKGRDPGGWPR